jgi:hypothetical protein
MQLISSIEIRYFRSIYKAKLDGLDGTNIFFGRNDSGKSNVLRALNLFFNEETNPGNSFVFDRDLSSARVAEAAQKKDTRKFVSVRITFNTPTNWQKSLGRQFWIKRSWSSSRGSQAHQETSIKSTSPQYLTRFLNNIKFHYIPAIKDRQIFENLLAEIYDVVASQDEFLKSLDKFSKALRARTLSLSQGIDSHLAVSSVIAPPTDLTELFRSLDFETENSHGDRQSLTLQRGDGVQVRHLPAILAFLSDQSPQDYHIWGFEEPENSLELANAIQEADAFAAYGSQNNKQVFLTSHSPAFFSLEREGVRRYFVSNADTVEGRPVSTILPLDSVEEGLPGDLMGETPHLPVISAYLRDAHVKIQEITASREQLATEIAAGLRPMVFMEGRTDCEVLRTAWEQFVGGAPPFDLIDSSGTTKMKSLASDGGVLGRLAPERLIFVLVDNDAEGRELLANKRLDDASKWVQHNSNKTYWRRLPFTPELKQVFADTGLQPCNWPGCLENLFSASIRRTAIAAGVYSVATSPHAELCKEAKWFPVLKRASDAPESDLGLYIMNVDHEKKETFASWVCREAATDPTILQPLEALVRELHEILCAE